MKRYRSTTAAASVLPRLIRFGGTLKDLNANPHVPSLSKSWQAHVTPYGPWV